MSELDVEAVDDVGEEAVPVGVDAPDYVLYGGKGGVGKTTMAAATALASARDGTPTLVVSTDPAHSLSDTLDATVPAEPGRIREDIPLFGAEIDPESAFQGDPLGVEEGLGPVEQLLGDDVVDPLMGSMPGTDEAAAIRLLIQYLDDERFERVVVDTAPTGHTLRLLELPEVMESLTGRLLSLRERFDGMMDNLTGLFGDDAPQEADLDAGMGSLRETSRQIERLRAVLRDPAKTDFRVVMVPEELSVSESERLLERLDAFDIPVETVVVNRVMEDLVDVAGIDPEWFVSPNRETCAFCKRRWDVQQRAIRQSQEIFQGHDVKRVPLFANEVSGEKFLRVVAACLEE